jgi:hypothetical protein
MSPEQARGERNIDYRSDIYSLGAVAYEMLTGERPFRADNLHELVYRQVTTEPMAPHELNPDVPQEVSEIISDCLRKEPERRIESAGALWRGLEAVVTARAGRPESPPRRGPVWIALPFVVVLAGGVAIALTLASRTGADSAFARAESLLAQAAIAAEAGNDSLARELHCAALEDYPRLAGQLPRGYCDPTWQRRSERIDQEAVRLYTRALLHAERGETERAMELFCQVVREYPAYTEAREAVRQLQGDATEDSTTSVCP